MMGGATYVAGGVLLCALVGALFNQHYSWMTLGCAALGALLPHAFERPRLMQRFGPQTLTHSLLGLMGCAVLVSPLRFLKQVPLFTALLIGYASHLLLDAATERGVLLCYPSRLRAVIPRHPLSRVAPGSSRERRLRWWLLGLWLVVLPLNAIGLRGLLHRLIPVVPFAVEDAITYGRHGRRVFVDFSGRFSVSQRIVSGRWEVLEPMTRTSLLVEDPQGRRYVLGTHPHDTIQVFTMRARKGPPVDVRLQRVALHEQVLGGLLPLIPPEGRTYLIGSVQTQEEVQPRFVVDQFQPIQVGNKRLELHYATAHDLQEAHLSGLYVTEGELLLRTLVDGGRTASSKPLVTTELSRSEAPHRTVSVIVHHLADPTEIVVRPDQLVKRGDLLADLVHRRSSLLVELRTAQAQLLAAHTDLVHLRLVHQQELSLKHTEDTLAGTHRNLASLHAKHQAELAHIQAHTEALSARLDRLDREMAATEVRSPVAGRILAVHLHQSTATLHLLADD